jgi:hypothetical protein
MKNDKNEMDENGEGKEKQNIDTHHQKEWAG